MTTIPLKRKHLASYSIPLVGHFDIFEADGKYYVRGMQSTFNCNSVNELEELLISSITDSCDKEIERLENNKGKLDEDLGKIRGYLEELKSGNIWIGNGFFEKYKSKNPAQNETGGNKK